MEAHPIIFWLLVLGPGVFLAHSLFVSGVVLCVKTGYTLGLIKDEK